MLCNCFIKCLGRKQKHQKKIKPVLTYQARYSQPYLFNLLYSVDQFRYTKIQPKAIDLSSKLCGISTEFVGFVSKSLVVLMSSVLG